MIYPIILKPVRCRDAVAEWLTHNSGTVIDIAAATGWGTTSIRTAISHLRFFADPCLKNFIRRPDPAVEEPEPAPTSTARMVETALANRTPLEQAWR